MLILNMLAKAVSIYLFLILHKEMEAGSIHPQEQGRGSAGGGGGGGGAYQMGLLSPTRESKGSIGSPDGERNLKKQLRKRISILRVLVLRKKTKYTVRRVSCEENRLPTLKPSVIHAHCCIQHDPLDG